MKDCWQCKWLDYGMWWDTDGEPSMTRCMHPEREEVGEEKERCSCFQECEIDDKGFC
jgi:hypothetical protein